MTSVHNMYRLTDFRTDSVDGVTMATDKCRKVVASNLPPDMITTESVTDFFESRRYCPAGGAVSHVELRANNHSAVVTFEDRSGSLTTLPSRIFLYTIHEHLL